MVYLNVNNETVSAMNYFGLCNFITSLCNRDSSAGISCQEPLEMGRLIYAQMCNVALGVLLREFLCPLVHMWVIPTYQLLLNFILFLLSVRSALALCFSLQ